MNLNLLSPMIAPHSGRPRGSGEEVDNDFYQLPSISIELTFQQYLLTL